MYEEKGTNNHSESQTISSQDGGTKLTKKFRRCRYGVMRWAAAASLDKLPILSLGPYKELAGKSYYVMCNDEQSRKVGICSLKAEC